MVYRSNARTEMHRLASDRGAIAIPDEGGERVESALRFITDGTVCRIVVGVAIEHPSIGDLVIGLRGPDGREVVLRAQAVSGEGVVSLQFDSDSHRELAKLVDQRAHGTWSILVRDLVARETGFLRSWTLELDVRLV